MQNQKISICFYRDHEVRALWDDTATKHLKLLAPDDIDYSYYYEEN